MTTVAKQEKTCQHCGQVLPTQTFQSSRQDSERKRPPWLDPKMVGKEIELDGRPYVLEYVSPEV